MTSFNRILQVSKITADYILILCSFVLAYFMRLSFEAADSFPYFQFQGFYLSSDFPFWHYFLPALPAGLLWIFILFYARAYKTEQNVRNFRHLERVIFAALVGMAAYLLTFIFLRKEVFSRLMIVYIFLFSATLIWLNHFLFSILARHYYKKGIGVRRTLIIGSNREAQKLVQQLKAQSSYHMPVAILDGYGSKLKEIAGVPVLGKLDQFEDTVNKQQIQQIIQTDNLEQTINIMNYALQNKIKYALLPSLFGAYHKNQYVEELEGIPVLRIE